MTGRSAASFSAPEREFGPLLPFGWLRPTSVWSSYDGIPRLRFLVGQRRGRVSGRRSQVHVLELCVEEEDASVSWLYASMTQRVAAQVQAGKLPLWDALSVAVELWLAELTVASGGAVVPLVRSVEFAKLPGAFLPKPGAVLSG